MGAAGAVNYLTTDKVAVMGAAGAVGSNLVQALLSTGTANTVAMYDPYGPGLEGAAEEIYHCAFPDAQVTWTTDAGEALDGATYVLSSGGAPRREGMTREDLLRGNAEIAAQLGRDLNDHAPEAKLVVIVFNPADITGLVTLVHSGLPPQRVTTLAALDSTRCRRAWRSTSACRSTASTVAAPTAGTARRWRSTRARSRSTACRSTTS